MAGVVRRDRSDRRPVIGYHEIRRQQSTFYCPVRRRRLETDATDPLELPLAHSGLGFQADRTGHRHPEGCRRQKIAFGYDHIRERKSRVLIDGKSLQPVGTREASDRVSAQLRAVASSFPGMRVHTLLRDNHLLRWETPPTNNDRKPAAIPLPSELVLYKIR